MEITEETTRLVENVVLTTKSLQERKNTTCEWDDGGKIGTVIKIIISQCPTAEEVSVCKLCEHDTTQMSSLTCGQQSTGAFSKIIEDRTWTKDIETYTFNILRSMIGPMIYWSEFLINYHELQGFISGLEWGLPFERKIPKATLI